VPIVLIEAFVLWRVASVQWKRSVIVVAKANVFSTLVGVPIVYVVLLLIQLVSGGGGSLGINALAVTLQAPWLIPYEDHLHWMIPAAALYLCVPFFVVSWLSERWCLRRLLKDIDTRVTARATLLGNALTYGLIAVYWLCVLTART
jgi:hypothetical protein